MLRTKRRRWLLVAALFFLAAFGVAIAQIVTAQGEEASGVRHIIRTNASGEIITSGGGTPLEVEGTTADGAAFTDNPVVIGGVDRFGNAQQIGASAVGVILTGQSVSGADGISNGLGGLPQEDGGGGFYQHMFPMRFNGATWDRSWVCSQSAPITSVAGTAQIIALSGTTVIRICHISLSWDAVVDFRIVQGTGANCGTGTANLTADFEDLTGVAMDWGTDAAIRSAAGNAVCTTQTGVGNAGGVVSYAQF